MPRMPRAALTEMLETLLRAPLFIVDCITHIRPHAAVRSSVSARPPICRNQAQALSVLKKIDDVLGDDPAVASACHFAEFVECEKAALELE